MSSITNTTISSYDYLLRQCYSSNRSARKSYGRSTLSADDLVRADSDALKKVTRNLKDMEYSTDNGSNIYNNVKAFIESYNNLFDSSDKVTSSADLTRAEKKLKNFIKNNRSSLEEIGIKVSSSGKLTMDKETLVTTSPSKLKKFFSDGSEFTSNVIKHSTRIGRISKTLLRSGNSQTKKAADASNPPVDNPVIAAMTANSIDFRA